MESPIRMFPHSDSASYSDSAMVIRPSYSDSAMVIQPSYSDSATVIQPSYSGSAMVIRPSYSDSAMEIYHSSFLWSLPFGCFPTVIRPSYSDSAIVALRKKRGGLKNSFCQVKNEKGLVSMHDLSSFTTTRIVVVNYGSYYPNCMLVSVF